MRREFYMYDFDAVPGLNRDAGEAMDGNESEKMARAAMIEQVTSAVGSQSRFG